MNYEKKETHNAFDGSEDVPGVILFGATGPGGRAVRNPIIMKNIVDHLEDLDLCHLYWSCKIFNDIIDQMDKICWQKRAQKFTDETDGRKFQNVESLVDLLAKVDGSFRQSCFLLMTKKARTLTDERFWSNDYRVAASFAHHGLLGHVPRLFLTLGGGLNDLHLIPSDHMGSLAACVTELLLINGRHQKTDHLLTIIDNLKCEELVLSSLCLETEETSALLRAMMKGVLRVHLNQNSSLNLDVLTQYDGEGKCESFECHDMNKPDMKRIRTWAENMNWNITKDEEKIGRDACRPKIFIERKKSLESTKQDKMIDD